jgi:hypothetical protein
LVSDIPAGDGQIANLFYSVLCLLFYHCHNYSTMYTVWIIFYDRKETEILELIFFFRNLGNPDTKIYNIDYRGTEAESKEKHGVWEPMPELTTYNLTLCPHHSRLQHIYHGQPCARVDLIPLPESTLSPSQGLWI